ncbi:phosphate signaling complex protein PhoU [Aerophototrophica crusticola]
MDDAKTTQPTRHIVNAYDVELRQLHALIMQMGTLAVQQIDDSIQAMVRRDVEAAEAVMQRDAELDALERKVENQTIRLLALRQPMARDLRDIVGALRIASNLERIGDFAANVAKRSLALQSLPTVELTGSLAPIGRTVADMLKSVIQVYESDDLAGALAVRDRDEEVDRAYTALFRELLTYMMESPQRITACTHLLFAAKNLERIGDHATNIAETIVFRIQGRLPEEERHKGDDSSFTVLGTDRV